MNIPLPYQLVSWILPSKVYLDIRLNPGLCKQISVNQAPRANVPWSKAAILGMVIPTLIGILIMGI